MKNPEGKQNRELLYLSYYKEKGVCGMAKIIYRICLIVCLAIAIGAGLFFYQKQQKAEEKEAEWTLVYQEWKGNEPEKEEILWHPVTRHI